MKGELEGFQPVEAGWELDEVDGFDLDSGLYRGSIAQVWLLLVKECMITSRRRGITSVVRWSREGEIAGKGKCYFYFNECCHGGERRPAKNIYSLG